MGKVSDGYVVSINIIAFKGDGGAGINKELIF
jgi:hypothetical protein